jgi:hypothetical protein
MEGQEDMWDRRRCAAVTARTRSAQLQEDTNKTVPAACGDFVAPICIYLLLTSDAVRSASTLASRCRCRAFPRGFYEFKPSQLIW